MNIVFDLDGTLIDSAPDIQSVACAVLGSLGKEGLSLAETRNFIGEGGNVWRHQIPALPAIGLSPRTTAVWASQMHREK